MPVIISGDTGITTPTYGGADTSEYLVPVTAFKNRLINSDMRIDQRNAGASVTGAAGNVFPLDRFSVYSDQASKLTTQQSTTAPTGFINSLLVTSSSAYSVGSTEAFAIRQLIEGLNVSDLSWGTANAKTVTLSFWVRSSLTGTFGGSVANAAFDRAYPFTYTISSANTFEYKTITIAGDTTGTWLTTNGTGIRLLFGLGAGASRSATAGAWTGTSNVYSATGAISVVGTNGATFYITGVQLEVGSTATSFDYRSYGTELALCQRYFYLLGANSSGGQKVLCSGGFLSSTQPEGVVIFPVTMRTAPSLSINAGTNYYAAEFAPSNAVSFNTFALFGASTTAALIYASGAAGTGGYYARLAMNNGISQTFVGFAAEL